MHPHALADHTSGLTLSSLCIMHVRTHLFTVRFAPLPNLPAGSCFWLILKLVKNNKYSSNSSRHTLPLAGSVSAAHIRTLHTLDGVLTPFPVQLVPSFPVLLFLSYLNLSPYLLPSVFLNLFLIASANQFSRLFWLIQHFCLLQTNPNISSLTTSGEISCSIAKIWLFLWKSSLNETIRAGDGLKTQNYC